MGLHKCLKSVRGFLSGTTLSQRINDKRSRRLEVCWHRLVLERLEDRICPDVGTWANNPFNTIYSELRGVLTDVQQPLTGLLDGGLGGATQIPIVGKVLGNAVTVVQGFQSNLGIAFMQLGMDGNPNDSQIQTLITNALGPTGLNILANLAPSGQPAQYVMVTNPSDPNANSAAGIGDSNRNDLEIEMQITQTLATNNSLTFSTGLGSLPIKIQTTGGVQLNLGYAFELQLLFNGQTLAIDPQTTQVPAAQLSNYTQSVTNSLNQPVLSGDDLKHELAVFVSATLPSATPATSSTPATPGFSATATIGFVQGQITPEPVADLTTAQQSESPENGFSGTFLLDNLGTDASGAPRKPTAADVSVNAQANLNMAVSGSLAIGTGSASDYPSINTDFHLSWGYDSTNDSTVAAPTVSFDNVNLDLGGVISQILAPIVSDIQQVTQPLQPVLKVLGTPIPGLSDVSALLGQGPVTLMQIAGAVAGQTGYGPLFDVIQEATNVITAVNNLQIGPNSVDLPLGGFDLDSSNLLGSQAMDPTDLANLDMPDMNPDLSVDDPSDIATQGLNAAVQSVSSALSSFPGAVSALDALAKNVSGALNNGFDLEFPIMSDPATTIFDMLLGKDSDLVTLTANFQATASGSGVPSLSFLGEGLSFGGNVNLNIHIKIGYDTHGIRELFTDIPNDVNNPNTDNVGDITKTVVNDLLDGFYVDDSSTIQISGFIGVSAGASFGIASASINGGISTGDAGTIPISVTMHDPGDPGDVPGGGTDGGKLRVEAILNGGGDPFSLSGELDASLGITVQVGTSLPVVGFVGYQKTFDIATFTLVDFNPPAAPVLASQAVNGQVTLYVGQDAGMRSGVGVNTTDGNTTNGPEIYTITHVSGDAATSPYETIDVKAYGVTQEITGVQSIVGAGFNGDLTVTVETGVTAAVTLTGGNFGHAYFTDAGTGTANLTAGEFDSTLIGGLGSNTLTGYGTGKDILVGGPSTNMLTGGPASAVTYFSTQLGTGSTTMIGGPGVNFYQWVEGDGPLSITGINPQNIPFNNQLMVQQGPNGGETWTVTPLAQAAALQIQGTAADGTPIPGTITASGLSNLAIDTTVQENYGVTTLGAPVTAGATQLQVSSGAAITATGEVIQIGDEQMLVTAINGDTLTVKRGYNGTKAVPHAVNSNSPTSLTGPAAGNVGTFTADPGGNTYQIGDLTASGNLAVAVNMHDSIVPPQSADTNPDTITLNGAHTDELVQIESLSNSVPTPNGYSGYPDDSPSVEQVSLSLLGSVQDVGEQLLEAPGAFVRSGVTYIPIPSTAYTVTAAIPKGPDATTSSPGDSLTVNTFQGNDTVNVYTTAGAGSTYINTGAGGLPGGANAITVGDANWPVGLDAIQGPLSIDAGNGLDNSLTFTESDSTLGDTLTLTNDALIRYLTTSSVPLYSADAVSLAGDIAYEDMLVGYDTRYASQISYKADLGGAFADGIELDTTQAADIVYVASTPDYPDTNVTVNTGFDNVQTGTAQSQDEVIAGYDGGTATATYDPETFSTLDGFGDPLTVVGDGAGSGVPLTELVVADEGAQSSETYTLTAQELDRGTARILFNQNPKANTQLRDLTLNAGPLGNTINIEGTNAATAAPPQTTVGGTTVDAGAGNNTILVGDTGKLDAIRGPLTVNGGAGTDSLTVDDTADGAMQSYVLGVISNALSSISAGTVTIPYSIPAASPNGIAVLFPIDIAYSAISSLNVNAGSGATAFTVQSTLATTTVNLSGQNNGANTLTGPAAPTDWQFTPTGDTIKPGSGLGGIVFGTVNFSGIAAIKADGDDDFQFMQGGVFDGAIDGGADPGASGMNTLDLSQSTLTGLGVDLTQDGTFDGVEGFVVFAPNNNNFSFNDIDALIGSAGSFLTGTGVANTYSGNFTHTLSVSGFASVHLTVAGNLSGQLLAPTEGTAADPVASISVTGAVTSSGIIKVGFLQTLTVTGAMDGLIKGFGNNMPMQTVPSIKSISVGSVGMGAQILAEVLATITDGGNFEGLLSEGSVTADFTNLTIRGDFTWTALVVAASADFVEVDGIFAGRMVFNGPVGTFIAPRGGSGSITTPSIGTNNGTSILHDITVQAVNIAAGDVAGLILAINQANMITTEANIIDLAPGSTYILTAPDNYWYGPNGLPAIASNITINGNINSDGSTSDSGAVIERANVLNGNTPINGGSSPTEGEGSDTSFRIFYVSGGFDTLPAGTLTLNDLTVQNGLAQGGNGGSGVLGGGGGAGLGGAVFNQGTLNLNGVTLTQNTAQGGNGGISDFAQFLSAEENDNFNNLGGGGGGGGLGGNGGNGNTLGANSGGGGGGGFATSGAPGSASSGGSGGNGTNGGEGGIGGGNQTSGGDGTFGGGGGGGGELGGGAFVGGSGGVGGGGGGGGGTRNGGAAGAGGFGGGGGGASNWEGGVGGFGGGGGDSPYGNGRGGFGGGHGDAYGAAGGGGMGGAIFNMSGVLNVTNSTLALNAARGGQGGQSDQNSGSGTGEGGSGLGGAIFNLNGSVTLINDTIADNIVVAGNLKTADGGALYNLALNVGIDNPPTATVILTNDILAGSSPAGAGGNHDVVNDDEGDAAKITGLGTNLIQHVASGTVTGGGVVINGDPVLGSLQNNGGPTSTMEVLAGSPLLQSANFGLQSTLTNGVPTTDQRGVDRGVPAGSLVDLGAYQATTATHFGFTNYPSVVFAGTSGFFTITAQDPFNKTVYDYASKVSFQVTGGATGTVPPPSALTNGTGTFADSMNTTGVQSLIASDGTIFSNTFVAVLPSNDTINATLGSGQQAAVGTLYGQPLEARVTDNGNGVSGVEVTFTVNPSGAGASGAFSSSTTVTTDANGYALVGTTASLLAADFTANDVAGAFTVTATTPGASRSATFDLTNEPGAPANITKIAGDNQSAPIGLGYQTPLQVEVTDADGNPVGNIPVFFTAPAAGPSGEFVGSSTATVMTNAAGFATAPELTANDDGGTFDVSASLAASVALTLTSINPASAPAGSPDTTITATGTNFVAGATVDWSGTPLDTTFVSSTQLTAVIPAADLTAAGAEPITVVPPTLGSSASAPQTFTINSTGPASVQFSAASETINETAGTFSVSVTVTGTVNPTASTFASGFNSPSFLAFDAEGNLYVANLNDGTVSKVTPGDVASTFAFGFSRPDGLAFDAEGNLYVANFTADTVSKVTPAGVVSTFASGFNGPTGLAIDATGNLYVANLNAGTVSKVTSAGVVSTFVSGFNEPLGLAIDADRNLYVANDGSNTVSKVTPARLVSTFAYGFDQPQGLAIDAAGNLYVANYFSGLSEVTPGEGVSNVGGNELPGIVTPIGLAFDAAGNLYVANNNYDTVSEITTSVSVPFTLGGTATAGTDYSGVTASPLMFPAGQTTATITGTLIGGAASAGKTLTFTLGTPTGIGLGSPSVNTLIIGEPAVAPVSFSETNSVAGIPALLAFENVPAQVSAGMAFSFQAEVLDQNGNLVTTDGSNVTATLIGPTGSTSTTIHATEQAVNGVASFTETLSQTGLYTVSVADGNLTPPTDATIDVTAVPAKILHADNSLKATVNTDFGTYPGSTTLPQITVEDKNSKPIAGITVTWTVEPGTNGANGIPSGSFAGPNSTTATTTTNSSGIALAPAVILAGKVAGNWKLQYDVNIANLTISGNLGTFPMVNVPGAFTALAPIVGSGQSTTVGKAFRSPLIAEAEDEFGNGVNGISVTWPPTPVIPKTPSAALSAKTVTSATTTVNGQSTEGVVEITATANAFAGGPYTVSAQASLPKAAGGGTIQGSFALTNNAATPTYSLIVTNATDPATLLSGTLRAAVFQANSDAAGGVFDTITFDNKKMGTSTITLSQGVLELSGAGTGTETINAGSTPITVNANNTSEVFLIDKGVHEVINALTITKGHSSDGGGISNNGVLTVTNCVLTSNSSTDRGGCIDNLGTLSVNDCTLSESTTMITGGAIDNFGTCTVTETTFSSNAAEYGGALGNEDGASISLTNCTLYDNSASVRGGGLACGQTAMPFDIIDCTIADNSAAQGGGIQTADVTTPGTLQDSIVALNTATTGPDIYVIFGSLSGSNNLIGNGSGQSGFSNGVSGNKVGSPGSPISPLLAALGNYGGTNQTMALLPGSPAIGAGVAESGITTDENGVSRPASAPDIGAFQTQGFTITAKNGTTPQSTGVDSAFGTLLAVTVTAKSPNDPVTGGMVTFAVSTGSTGAGGTFTGGQSTVSAPISGGAATAPALTSNGTAGKFMVDATVAGVSATPVAFALTNTAGAAASVTANSGTPQTVTAGKPFAALVAKVTDKSGNLVSGATVTFTVNKLGGNIVADFPGKAQTATAKTNASGLATAPTLTSLVVTGGTFTVTASVTGATTSATFSLTLEINDPVVSPPQSATVGRTFATALYALVTDAAGKPVAGVPVTFSAPASGPSGTFAGKRTASVLTNAKGIATAPAFKANTQAGAFSLKVVTQGVPDPDFISLTNLPGQAATINIVSGNGQGAGANSVYAVPLEVRVTDVFGNVISGETVTFTVRPHTINGTAAAFGDQTTATATTDDTGLAVAPPLKANGKRGSFSVIVSLAGDSREVTFELTVTN